MAAGGQSARHPGPLAHRPWLVRLNSKSDATKAGPTGIAPNASSSAPPTAASSVQFDPARAGDDTAPQVVSVSHTRQSW